ncbi:asparagine synthase-related protein [Sorangium sp. So ce1099]|uniref:asparagine synthase-related protein n=1 Tax=Sorangium sp. So ce1099 TaxID=3133331 RepID=UPI003F6171FB
MLLSAFGMCGRLPLPHRADVAARYSREIPPPSWTESPGTGHLVQGPVYTSRKEIADAATGPAPRVLLTGWIELSLPPDRRDDEGAALREIEALLDEHGPEAVKRLRGDFVIAHLSPDRSELRLYRGINALIPLFWRCTADSFAWATNPAHLLDVERPRFSDVDVELLPMIIAGKGFPQDRSWFTSVRRLPAGESLLLAAGARQPVVRRFDQFSPADSPPRTLREAADGLQQRIAEACSRMLSTERSAVVLLSGGIDSAAVSYEVGRQLDGATGLHFTLESFPGFREDLSAAESVARTCGLSLVPYDMSKHVARGGDYVDGLRDGAVPQTQVPLQSVAAAAAQAESEGATFVVSGLLSDQVLAHDLHRGLFEVAGLSMLNPMVAGEPIWQTLGEMASSSFAGSQRGGRRVLGILRYLRGLLDGDPTVALPSRDVIVHPIGFTSDAADRVTRALQTSARRAQDSVRSAIEDSGHRGNPLPRGITSLYMLSEAFNTANVQAAWLNDCLPRRRFFATPFADRDVIEYALTLPTRYRLGFGYGATVDKFALRLAYADRGVPLEIAHRTQQARIDAMPAVFVNQNFDRCQRLLGQDSVLCELNVLSREFVRGLSPKSIHRNGEEIARLCVIEQWLRGLAR